jgi:hypothetical protein
MSILSFGKFANQKMAEQASDWSNQDMADFFRAHRLLAQNGATIGIDRGRSDTGEPWLVFYDSLSQDVFLHIARINGVCVLICEHLSIKIKADRIDHLVNRFEEAVRTTLSIRVERASNVVTHPASKIIMSISAVFLLFKLDMGNQAFAKELLPHGADLSARKADSIQARLQTTLARLFEGAETPVAMAALAVVILGSDIALAHRQTTGEFDADQLAEISQADETTLHLHNSASGQQVDSQAPALNKSSDAPETIIAQTGNVEVTIVPDVDLKLPASALDLLLGPSIMLSAAAQVFVPSAAGTDPVAVEVPKESGTTSSGNVTTAPVTAAAEPLAVQLLQSVAALNFKELNSDLTAGVLVSASGEIVAVLPDDMPESAMEFGFEAQTFLGIDDLTTMLEHIIAGIGAYEIEMNGNVLSIAQSLDAGIDQSQLGIWTNMMSDGSSIAIVGALDLIDDVGSLLAA